jgi:release factor glutamine methyltransferase
VSSSIRAVCIEAQNLIAQTLGLSQNEARLEAQVLLRYSLKVDHAWLLSHENDALQPNIHAGFEALLKRRLNGEPIAYILGKREFYGLKFMVTPDTLIPRPDTETLVDAALAKISADKSCSVLDLGTGTGVIAIAIASQRPRSEVIATDQSPAALALAEANAQKLEVNNVQFALGDWFATLKGQTFDVIVSNPPYIAEHDEHLNQGDLRFEPRAALASGEDGLNDIRKIIQAASQHLKPQGWLMLEHGHDQAKRVASLMENAGFKSISSIADLPGMLRVTVCQFLP